MVDYGTKGARMTYESKYWPKYILREDVLMVVNLVLDATLLNPVMETLIKRQMGCVGVL
jgi:hypothetical protein